MPAALKILAGRTSSDRSGAGFLSRSRELRSILGGALLINSLRLQTCVCDTLDRQSLFGEVTNPALVTIPIIAKLEEIARRAASSGFTYRAVEGYGNDAPPTRALRG
jgi:hypothetical protein